jgi:hypothetical protein
MSEIVKTVKKLKRGLSFLLVTLSVAIFTLLSWVLESGELSLSALEPSLLRSSESGVGAAGGSTICAVASEGARCVEICV